ncbi:MAG: hypothetical protein ABIE03_03530 [Patescibacteria group bacterium]|nr:hypothetical protein [Patescibacteria group bacterium]
MTEFSEKAPIHKQLALYEGSPVILILGPETGSIPVPRVSGNPDTVYKIIFTPSQDRIYNEDVLLVGPAIQAEGLQNNTVQGRLVTNTRTSESFIVTETTEMHIREIVPV